MISKLFTLLSVLFIVACNTNKPIEAKAYIFERKMLEDGKLMVCYSFKNGNTVIRDSIVIDNLILSQDSVAIVFQKNYPENSNLLLTPGN
ncbi:hypothetical protein BH10BAC2_BH10BAC2_18240 [soil metagenome]